MLPSLSILVVSGEPAKQKWLVASIPSCGKRPVCCGTYKNAVDLLDQRSLSIMFCDGLLQERILRIVMKHVARCGIPTPLFVTSRRDEWDSFLRASNVGAFDCTVLPPLSGEMERLVCAALTDCEESLRAEQQQRRSGTQSAALKSSGALRAS
jgi:DNA-binding NtrC family response regulator